MQTEPQEFAPQPIAGPPLVSERKLLAPVWHTILIVLIMLTISYFTASQMSSASQQEIPPAARVAQYVEIICLQLFLLLFVWIGLRLKKFTLRELIGGRWESPEDFLIDFGIALGFWVASSFILVGL